MARTHYEQKLISRRAMIFGGVQFVAAVGLLTRLHYLQFVQGDALTTEAEGNRIKVQLLVPPRGEMVDRTGALLAGNDINYRLLLDRDHPAQAIETFDKLATMLAWSPAFIKKTKQMIHPKRPADPLLVLEHVPWDALARIEFHLPELPAVRIEEGRWRNYPLADKASHLLGYVGRVSEKELSKDSPPLLRQPDMKIGKNGVEVLLEDRLRGHAGMRHLEVNVRGRVVRELKEIPATAGEKVALTIDAQLQQYIVERLGEESGGVVVMDIHTGELLALVSNPAFDPNSFSKGILQNYWNELLKNEKNPLLNKAIAGLYPPGSTFKMLVGLAGLKKGVINTQSRIYCPGHFYLGNHRFNCWKPEGHGSMSYRDAIAQSCDTFFYTVGRNVGMDAIADMAHEFGLGALTGLGLRGERAGIIPNPEWKRKTRGLPWNPGETINASIGQGDVIASPLQMAVMVARMANGGKKITPRITPLADGKMPAFEFIDIDPLHMKEMLIGMDMVTNNPRGTAYASGIRDEAYMFGGKTGTSQVRRITVRGQNQNLIPWKYRHHAWFVGYAPISNPRYAVSVLIEHGGGGSSAAAPVARDVLLKTQQIMEAAKPSGHVLPPDGDLREEQAHHLHLHAECDHV